MQAFRTRVRKGTRIPYVTHLLSVMCTVGEYGGDEEQMMAAVLHDWLEDIDGATVDELHGHFGARVARLVHGLSDSVGHPKPPWRERKLRYLAQLRDEPAELKLISAADKLHNCNSIRRDLEFVGEAVWSRFSSGRDDSLWYYEEVVTALGHGWDHPLHRRLVADVEAMLREARDAHEAAAGPRLEVVMCRTSVARLAPELEAKIGAAGGRLGLVDCFDRCEICERSVLARLDGTMARFRTSAELLEAVTALREAQ